MKNIANAESDGKSISALFDLWDCPSILDWGADWDENWGHPYFWPWVDDIFREQVIHCLLESDKRQTDYAGKEMLRWLFFRFRSAQRHTNAKTMPDDFRQMRWTWATHAEVTADTYLSEHQIRRAVDRLEERGLIRMILDNKLRWVPHYRPTDDLFRVARMITALSNWRVVNYYCQALGPSSTKAANEDFLRAYLAVMRKGPLLGMIRDFAQSDAPDRVDTFQGAWNMAIAGVDKGLRR